jgi:hypothetical protein
MYLSAGGTGQTVTKGKPKDASLIALTFGSFSIVVLFDRYCSARSQSLAAWGLACTVMQVIADRTTVLAELAGLVLAFATNVLIVTTIFEHGSEFFEGHRQIVFILPVQFLVRVRLFKMLRFLARVIKRVRILRRTFFVNADLQDILHQGRKGRLIVILKSFNQIEQIIAINLSRGKATLLYKECKKIIGANGKSVAT